MSHEIFSADKILKKNRLISMNLTDNELTRPLVLILCEQGCEPAVEHVKFGILTGGGCAAVINMPSLCDMAAEGAGKGTLLFAREAVADLTESLLSIYSADGAAIIASSEAAAAGMIMGAVRRNIPLAFLPAFFTGAYYPARLIDTRAAVTCGKAGISDLEDLQCGIDCGRSMEMDNLNSLCVFLEGCGIAIKDSTGALSVDEKIHKARKCGEIAASRAITLSYPRKNLTMAAVSCGLAAFIATGGTAAALLNVLAIANENQLGLDLKQVEALSAKLPRLAAVSPEDSRYSVADFVRAGGVFAVLKELLKIPKLLSPALKIGEKDLVELIAESDSRDTDIIARLESPFDPEGGFSILKGNLFDYGIFVRGIKEKSFKGTAVVCDSEEQLRAAVFNGSVKDGSAVIVRGQGAKDNGMPLLDLQSAARAAGLSGVVIITDGRALDTGGCPVISLCSGGVMAAVKTGDPIEIDFKKCKVNLNVPGKEINNRLKKLKNIDEIMTGGLIKYAYLVGEPDNGCILKQKF